MKNKIRLTENQLHRVINDSINNILNEIGDTPSGNFALNAVRGRRAAKRYRANMGLKDRAENDSVMGQADDTMYKNFCNNKSLGYTNDAGYRYGFDKGVEKYKGVNEEYKPLGAKYSKDFIFNLNGTLKRQFSNLLQYLNAYSDAILSNNILDENTYDELYNILSKVSQ